MSFVTGYDVGKEFCKALGIDPHCAKEVIIRVPADDLVTVTVTSVCTRTQLDQAMKLVSEQFVLTRKVNVKTLGEEK